LYDSHFLLKEICPKYKEYRLQNGKVQYADIKIIPLNSEKNLQIQIGNVLYLDSFQFMAASLNTLVGTLRKSGTDQFVHTSRYMGTEDFLFQKGVFPYEYFTDFSKFQETASPPKDAFFNRLTNESLTDADDEQTLKVWNYYDMKNLQQHHHFYMTTDVLLLTDVFESFRGNDAKRPQTGLFTFSFVAELDVADGSQDYRRQIGPHY